MMRALLRMALVAVLVLLSIHAGAEEADRSFHTVVGETKILADNLRLLEGGEEAIAGRPRVLILHFVDCVSGRCEESLKEIDQYVWQPLKESGAAVAGIAVDSQPEEARKLSEKLGLGFPLLADPDRTIFNRVAAGGVPRTLILDAEGLVRYQHAGYRTGRDAEFRFVAEKLLDGKPIPAALAPRADAPDLAPSVSEELHAKDIRGEKAPSVPVETWINPMPSASGKYMMVDFWATWCGPCIVSLQEGERLHERFDDRLATMAISDENPELVKKFIQSKGWKQPIGVDTRARAMSELNVMGIPHAFIANPDGKVVWQGHPMELWSGGGLLLESILNGKEYIPEENQ